MIDLNQKTKAASFDLSQKLSDVFATEMYKYNTNDQVDLKKVIIFALSNLIIGISTITKDESILDYVSSVVLQNMALEAEEKKNKILV